jgi:hypothetical protein
MVKSDLFLVKSIIIVERTMCLSYFNWHIYKSAVQHE